MDWLDYPPHLLPLWFIPLHFWRGGARSRNDVRCALDMVEDDPTWVAANSSRVAANANIVEIALGANDALRISL